jgi:hypothetical protein
METYWGLHAEEITFAQFWGLMWRQRWEMLRYLRWAARMNAVRNPSARAKKFHRGGAESQS